VIRVNGATGAVPGLVRNQAMARVAGAYALFILSEYSVWIAMLVYAYARGGATAAGLVATAQLVPAALLAPVFARLGTRRSPATLLAGGYLLQAAAMAATAAAVRAGVPVAAYAGAVVASTMVTTTRPAQAALVPSLATTPDQLTAANVVLGWVEAVCITLSGLLVGVLLPVAGVGGVLAVCAALALLAVALVAGLRAQGATRPLRRVPENDDVEDADAEDGEEEEGAAGWTAGAWRLVRESRLRVLVGLLAAQATVVGGLDLLFVVLAVDVLHRSQAWAGYLNLAYGIGAVGVTAVSAVLVGRRLGAPVLASVLVLGAALAALAIGPGLPATVALVAVAGAARAVLDVAVRTLLQRTAPVGQLGQVFGLAEGLVMAGLALGALLVPALVRLGGTSLAFAGVAAVLPLGALVGGRSLLRLDAEARVPVVEIALLRSLPLFAELPPPQLEGLAGALQRTDLSAGTVLLRQGEPGDDYYAIASGQLEAWRDGVLLRRCGRGEGVGEIALLGESTRTATVVAATDAIVYRLGRDPFLAAVTRHAATFRRAASIASDRLATRA
jgi:MFS family permease